MCIVFPFINIMVMSRRCVRLIVNPQNTVSRGRICEFLNLSSGYCATARLCAETNALLNSRARSFACNTFFPH